MPNARPQRLLAGTALSCVAALCAWTLAGSLFGDSDSAAAFADRFDSVATSVATAAAARSDKLASSVAARFAAMRPSSPALSNAFASLFDRRFSLGYTPGGFVKNVALASQTPAAADEAAVAAAPDTVRSAVRVAAAPPMPVPRPRFLARLAALRDGHAERTAGAQRQDAPQESSNAHEPTLFEKLFGKPKPVALAYAASDDAGLGRPVNIVARYDSNTAVYDISAKTVYLPDGRRLEAHSGLGQYLDDPHHVDLRMRGATPPTIYDLSVRDGLFHGVRALRLTPEDESKVYGRAGLLAHTFMLGPNGDSNGCVSFRNYEAFLQAYLDHKVTKLAVVSSLD